LPNPEHVTLKIVGQPRLELGVFPPHDRVSLELGDFSARLSAAVGEGWCSLCASETEKKRGISTVKLVCQMTGGVFEQGVPSSPGGKSGAVQDMSPPVLSQHPLPTQLSSK